MKNVAKKKMHAVDGQMITIDEAAAMVGVTPEALRQQKARFRGISVQHLVDMYRDGRIAPEKRAPDAHRVHGQWMTTNDVAARFGYAVGTVWGWRHRHRGPDGRLPSLEAAYDHYAAVARGEERIHAGSVARRLYFVNGKQFSMRQAAEAAGVPESTLRSWVKRHGCSVHNAVKHYKQAAEAAKTEAAAREIMRALGF